VNGGSIPDRHDTLGVLCIMGKALVKAQSSDIEETIVGWAAREEFGLVSGRTNECLPQMVPHRTRQRIGARRGWVTANWSWSAEEDGFWLDVRFRPVPWLNGIVLGCVFACMIGGMGLAAGVRLMVEEGTGTGVLVAVAFLFGAMGSILLWVQLARKLARLESGFWAGLGAEFAVVGRGPAVGATASGASAAALVLLCMAFVVALNILLDVRVALAIAVAGGQFGISECAVDDLAR